MYSCVVLLVLMEVMAARAHHVRPRIGARFFMRLNTKVDVVPYTSIFAYASGFRINWDLRASSSSPVFPPLYRSHLHNTIEETLNRYGLEGRACIIRAFCELALIQSHTDIISNLLKVIFKVEEAVTCPENINCPLSLVSLSYLIYGFKNNSSIE